MADIRLTTPRLRISRPDQPDIEVQTINADLVLWDRTRFKHKWPAVGDAPFLWLTFIGWAAARRTGLVNGETTYEAWEASVLEVQPLDLPETDEQGRPIPPGPEPG